MPLANQRFLPSEESPKNRHPMNLKQRSAFYAGLLVCSALATWPLAASAQESSPAPKADAAKPAAAKTEARPAAANDEPLVLSPFTVTTDKDRGYAATNAISGSRINTAIKDLPIPIQVITSEFISDIGATDLRQSLGYVSGIMLQSQNDLGNTGGGGYGGAYGRGGVNNPEGLTSNINQVQFKIRGFVTNNVLRDGFLRASATDSVNIDRIEVVSGPNSLLYGTGNFGGVVDYLTKLPSDRPQGLATFSYGTDSFMRGALDVTGPISKENHLNYRVGVAVESGKTNIDFQKNSHTFVAPSVSWSPNGGKTLLLIDTEFGNSKQNGYGFRALRAVQGQGSTPINNDQIEAVGFYWRPGADRRTSNLSGPDTYNNQSESNIELKLTQQITAESKFMPEINALIGYNHSKTNFKVRSVDGQMAGPVLAGQPGYALSQTIVITRVDNSIDGQGTDNANLIFGTLPNTIIKSVWSRNTTEATRDQERFELTLKKTLFDDSWYRVEDQVLAGVSKILNNTNDNTWLTVPNGYSYKSPNELSPILYSKQGDGSAVPALYQSKQNAINKGWDAGYYLNNYAKLLKDDRVILMTGIREDKIDKFSTGVSYSAPGATPSTDTARAMQLRLKTNQVGLSVKLTKNLSIYGLKAQGLQPNFDGRHSVYDGSPVGGDTAKSKEIGLKFDFFEGKLSGTISRYKIAKVAWTGAPWFSPTTIPHDGKLRFDPSKDVVYQIGTGGFNAKDAPGALNPFPNVGGGAGYYSSTQQDPKIVALWNAAVTAGDVYEIANPALPAGRLYLNGSHPAGKAYVDTAFAQFNKGNDTGGWAGWLWDGDGDANNYIDPNVNNATMDAAGFYNARVGENASILVKDESKGTEAQVIFTPNNSFQFVLTASFGSSVMRIDPGTWAKYPSTKDPNTSWNHLYFGLGGQPITVAYTDPSDTSTHTNVGVPPGDDTPKTAVDLYSNYKFNDQRLKGLSVGLGLQWHSKEQYFSGVTHGSGQAETNAAGKPIIAYTPSKLNVDLNAKYTFKTGGYDQFVQLNIGNVLDDTKIYGLIYNSPISGKISYGIKF